jgi:hypothetical protein
MTTSPSTKIAFDLKAAERRRTGILEKLRQEKLEAERHLDQKQKEYNDALRIIKSEELELMDEIIKTLHPQIETQILNTLRVLFGANTTIECNCIHRATCRRYDVSKSYLMIEHPIFIDKVCIRYFGFTLLPELVLTDIDNGQKPIWTMGHGTTEK